MNVLGIDTATFVTAVGVRRDGRLHAELHAEGRGGHAASLPGLVEQGLREAGLRAADLDGIAVSEGPGSFTGLRVGVSFAKAVAYATGARLVGVPTLPAIARALETPSDVVGVCLDARRGDERSAPRDQYATSSPQPARSTARDECLVPDVRRTAGQPMRSACCPREGEQPQTRRYPRCSRRSRRTALRKAARAPVS